jgi:hypothetical protein
VSARAVQTVGVVAEYASPEALLRAVGEMRRQGYGLLDAFAPYPVKGLEDALGLSRSWLNRINWAAAAFGAAFAFWLQWLVNRHLFELNIGGRPSFAIPPFIIVTFETMVLFAGVTTLVSFAWACRLPRLVHPLFAVEGFESASVDRFWLGVSADDPAFDAERTARELWALGASRVELAWGKPWRAAA